MSGRRKTNKRKHANEDDLASVTGPPNWRWDPEAGSYSDWTIKVTNEASSTTTTYHVHRLMMAAGDVYSLYFKGLFNSGMAETKTAISEYTFPDSEAKAFPTFLDYVYGLIETPGKKMMYDGRQLSHQILSSVLWLSSYFQVQGLESLVPRVLEKTSCHGSKDKDFEKVKSLFKVCNALEGLPQRELNIRRAAERLKWWIATEFFSEVDISGLYHIPSAIVDRIHRDSVYQVPTIKLLEFISILVEAQGTELPKKLIEKAISKGLQNPSTRFRYAHEDRVHFSLSLMNLDLQVSANNASSDKKKLSSRQAKLVKEIRERHALSAPDIPLDTYLKSKVFKDDIKDLKLTCRFIPAELLKEHLELTLPPPGDQTTEA